MQSPFFAAAYLSTKRDNSLNDGYQLPFQKGVFHAALFYLFLSLIFLKKTLELYQIKWPIVILCQLLLVFATPVTNYANYEAGFSHIYSLFAITTFIFLIASYFRYLRIGYFLWACFFLALIFLLRQVNILIILFLPFLAGCLQNFLNGVRIIFQKIKILLLGIIIAISIISIQGIFWYLQTGNFILYSYQEEGFNWFSPRMIDILFSYRKGLFVYTPVFFISLIGLVFWIYKKQYFLFITWVSFFLLLTYVLSSWWFWSYGGSFGLRAYLEYGTVFFIPFAVVLNNTIRSVRLIIVTLSILIVPLNIIQAYQYKNYILHNGDMNKQDYWKVFLKTEERFEGLLYKKHVNLDRYNLEYEAQLGDLEMSKDPLAEMFAMRMKKVPNYEKVSVIRISLEDEFYEGDKTKIRLTIKGESTNRIYYDHSRYLLHFHVADLNEPHAGFFYYVFDLIKEEEEKIISLRVENGKEKKVLKNLKLSFHSKN